jgi:hypothetical protein
LPSWNKNGDGDQQDGLGTDSFPEATFWPPSSTFENLVCYYRDIFRPSLSRDNLPRAARTGK